MPTQRPPLRARARDLLALWSGLFARHELLVYAGAVAFQTLVALVPLALLGLALLGAFHRTDVWTQDIAPTAARKLTPTSYSAVQASVDLIFARTSAGLIAFAAALTVWDVAWSVRACIAGMNKIYESDEHRPALVRIGTSAALAVAITVCLATAAVLVTFVGGVADGPLQWLLSIARWIAAILVVAAAVALLVRFGPADRRPWRWDSAGAALIVLVWLAASLLFKLYVTSVANFQTAVGQLTVFLVLTAYVYTSSVIFLVGVQLDELLRARAPRGSQGRRSVRRG